LPYLESVAFAVAAAESLSADRFEGEGARLQLRAPDQSAWLGSSELEALGPELRSSYWAVP